MPVSECTVFPIFITLDGLPFYVRVCLSLLFFRFVVVLFLFPGLALRFSCFLSSLVPQSCFVFRSTFLAILFLSRLFHFFRHLGLPFPSLFSFRVLAFPLTLSILLFTLFSLSWRSQNLTLTLTASIMLPSLGKVWSGTDTFKLCHKTHLLNIL